MMKDICKDVFLLSQKSKVATKEDLPVAIDLLETLMAHKDHCVGMAANMIGKNICIIAVNDNGKYLIMLNPVIIQKSKEYKIEEGCLSLTGVRETIRYQNIKVRYQDMSMKTITQTYNGFTAQIIQHEIDHCNGILI